MAAPAARVLGTIGDLAVAQDLERLQREARARTLAHSLLATEVVVRLDTHRRLHVETVDLGSERSFALGVPRAGPSTGAAAVAGVATFLSRIGTLEKGDDPARAGTRKEDKKAVELLAKRGLDKEERSRLAALVELAFRPTAALPAPRELDAKRATARTTALVALRDWYEEWAAIARVVVKRRDYRIRMGIARKSRKQAAVPSAPMVATAAKPA